MKKKLDNQVFLLYNFSLLQASYIQHRLGKEQTDLSHNEVSDVLVPKTNLIALMLMADRFQKRIAYNFNQKLTFSFVCLHYVSNFLCLSSPREFYDLQVYTH